MATSYPNGIDNFSNPLSNDRTNSVAAPHAKQHTDVNDAIEAIEAELGVVPKGIYPTVKDRLDYVDTQLNRIFTGTDQWYNTAIQDGTLSEEKFVAVTGFSLADDSITTHKLVDGAVTLEKLATDAKVYVVATSGTRPGSPVNGQLVFETDTKRLVLYDGTGWMIVSEPRQSYTPTWTNVTLGSGTSTGNYERSSGILYVTGKLTLGAGSAITGLITASLPVAVGDSTPGQALVNISDASPSAQYRGVGLATTAGATTIGLGVFTISGSYAVISNTSSTVPITWASSDFITFQARLSMNTRYL